MRVNAPGLTPKDVWDALVASYGVVGSYGALLEDTLDQAVSSAIIPVISSDVASLESSTSYAKNKEIYTAVDLASFYTLFGIKSSSAGQAAYGRIYKSGSPDGTERVNTTTTTVYYTETLTAYSAGDLIQLYLKSTGAYSCTGEKFRLGALAVLQDEG